MEKKTEGINDRLPKFGKSEKKQKFLISKSYIKKGGMDMNKILLGLVALSTLSIGAQGDTYLNTKFGGDFVAKYNRITISDQNREVPILDSEANGLDGEIAFEAYRGMTDNFDLGLGLSYQFHSEREEKSNGATIKNNYGQLDSKGGEYDSIPLYLIAKYSFNKVSNFTPYLKANLGYSFNINPSDVELSFKPTNQSEKTEIEVDNGLYWSIGGGMEYNNITLELTYALNKAKSKLKNLDEEKVDNDYGRFVLSAGYRFDL